jgi:hypothetical protein
MVAEALALALAITPAAAPAPAQPEGHGGHAPADMEAALGPYGISREASGTSWQPEASPHRAVHLRRGPWQIMLHGMAQVVATRQGGPRGADDLYANHMVMGRAARPLGCARLGLRGMLSLEPATIGREGYALLLQSGETADGLRHLVDRQHPHDLFMELAVTLSLSARNGSAFLYAGLPGEPALGPPTFMHRFSSESFPEAPISHHWLDSSHITFGVLTGGVTWGALKLEASAFRGREPDQHRWDIERPTLDSHAFRGAWNPGREWALQASHGRLAGPEQLEPDLDVDRTTASLIHHLGDRGPGHLQTLLAWGRNRLDSGRRLDAWLLESTLEHRQRHRVFAGAERVEKNELFEEGDPRSGVHAVAKLALGYAWEGWRAGPFRLALGALGSLSLVPKGIRAVYGDAPLSGSAFVQARLP